MSITLLSRGAWRLGCVAALGLLAPAVAAAQDDERALVEAIEARASVDLLQSDERKARAALSDFEEIGPCDPAPPMARINPDRSLWVHDLATLNSPAADFRLRRTLDELAAQAVAAGAGATTATAIFEELWDTQNIGPSLGLGAHCDDNTTAGIPGFTLNDFPLSCRPGEGGQATGSFGLSSDDFLDGYIPIGLVNRLDLADADWRSCGEYRIVYAKRPGLSPGRNFIIFEAVLPNPRPGCRSACRPVVDFWADLSVIADPDVRAARLEQFYYHGLPGFRPVVHIDHYSFGTSTGYGSADGGQIRTNQFIDRPWLLKEFKLAIVDDGMGVELDVVPVTVKANPYGELFNSALPGSSPFFARSLAFEADFLGQLGNLDEPDINRFFYVNDDAHNWGESDAQGLVTQNYRIQTNLPGAPTLFTSMLDSHAPPLDHDHFANRALTQSCGGCHEPSAYGIHVTGSIADPGSPIAAPVSPFAPAGTTTRWPPSLGFTHTNESPVGIPPNDFYPLSQALTDVFLPARRANMADFLAKDICPCGRRFVTVGRDDFERARRVQVDVFERFGPEIAAVRRELAQIEPGARSLRQIEGLRAEAGALAQAADDTVVEALAQDRIDVPRLGVALRPEPLFIDVARRADGDEAFAALLVVAELQAMSAAEPPRVTADGLVRTH